MTMPIYNEIGATYQQTRTADPRIVAHLIAFLDLPIRSTIADIGAGTGNYSCALAERGYLIQAVEPSSVMRAQAVPHHAVRWHDGIAEALPLPANSVNGVICTLALHHFSDVPASISEMMRIAGDGPIVIFTFDPRVDEQFWLYQYFPSFKDDALRVFPPIADLAARCRRQCRRPVTVHAFPLLADLCDRFCAAAWQHPEQYLDPAVQAGISSFALAEPAEVARGIAALQQDITDGTWDRRFGALRAKSELDVGYRFLVIERKESVS